MTKVDWHPYPEHKPKADKWYLITTIFAGHEALVIAMFRTPILSGDYWVMPSGEVTATAWAELPEPYKRGCDEQSNS